LTADVLAKSLGHVRIWHSNPTWPNHLGIFRAAGLTPVPYRYLTERETMLDFSAMVEDWEKIPEGSAVLVHTVCHNPTGFDLGRPHWEQLAELVARRRLITVFDFAYQGWSDSLERDAWPIRHFCSLGLPLFVCNSFSKNMGLYGERVGCCTLMAPTPSSARSLLSHLKLHARCSYSNPVRHGAHLAAHVLTDPALRSLWNDELNAMRLRLTQLRELWLETMREVSPHLDFDFVLHQRGMFSYSGLDAQQIEVLREKYSIYALNNGRINIAGIRPHNVERLCTAVADVCEQFAPSRSEA
jgi:aspartate/tyrosine/aromatic aminotransferase